MQLFIIYCVSHTNLQNIAILPIRDSHKHSVTIINLKTERLSTRKKWLHILHCIQENVNQLEVPFL